MAGNCLRDEDCLSEASPAGNQTSASHVPSKPVRCVISAAFIQLLLPKVGRLPVREPTRDERKQREILLHWAADQDDRDEKLVVFQRDPEARSG